MAFSRAYTPTAICSAARASLYTGVYAHRHGVLNNVTGPEAVRTNPSHDLPTAAEMLKGAGYHTGHVGKWHVALDDAPAARGFIDDRAGDAMVTDDDRFEDYRNRWGAPGPTTVTTRYPEPGLRASKYARFRFPMYATDTVAQDATLANAVHEEADVLLQSYATTSEPFFLVASFIDPHWPNVLPDPWASMYDPADIAPWPNFNDSFEGKPRTNAAGLEHFGVGHLTWDDWAPFVAHYLGAVSYTDHFVAKLLTRLDSLGLTDSTVVMASADHGDMAGSHRQFNKGPLMYEEVYRIPLMVRWPGVVAPGSTSNGLASLIDLTPTLADIAGAPVPDGLHGRNLTPVLRGEVDAVREALMCEYHGDEFGLYSQRMIRRDQYKLVYNPNDVRELYDLDNDPHELRNLAYEPDCAELRQDLEGHLVELMEESADPLFRFGSSILG